MIRLSVTKGIRDRPRMQSSTSARDINYFKLQSSSYGYCQNFLKNVRRSFRHISEQFSVPEKWRSFSKEKEEKKKKNEE